MLLPEEQTKIKCGSDGFLQLIDVSGSDEFICHVARHTSGSKGIKLPPDDRALIRYLIRNMHTTPIEFAEACFFWRVPMDTWRQGVRHRTASINEYSTRYREAIDECNQLDADEWRLQSKTNRQGSSGGVVQHADPTAGWPEGYELKPVRDGDQTVQMRFPPEGQGNPFVYGCDLTPGAYLTERQEKLQAHARQVYEERVAFGVAFEVARTDLPLSTYTELFWKCDLNNILKFLSLRMHSHAQKEIREYADAMYEMLKPRFPYVIEAFDDFDSKRGGLLLSRLDVEVIKGLLDQLVPDPDHPDWASLWGGGHEQWNEHENWLKGQGRKNTTVGERVECLAKLKRLGIVPEKIDLST
jgi:thymidylate synthase (FAD)